MNSRETPELLGVFAHFFSQAARWLPRKPVMPSSGVTKSLAPRWAASCPQKVDDWFMEKR